MTRLELVLLAPLPHVSLGDGGSGSSLAGWAG
jgi:hypothetical protein